MYVCMYVYREPSLENRNLVGREVALLSLPCRLVALGGIAAVLRFLRPTTKFANTHIIGTLNIHHTHHRGNERMKYRSTILLGGRRTRLLGRRRIRLLLLYGRGTWLCSRGCCCCRGAVKHPLQALLMGFAAKVSQIKNITMRL